jgi:hypothetical protein
MQIPQSRITSRDGVNAVRTFFEHHGCVFQEVGLENDFGKDAYLDLGENGKVTPLCAALQVKSGVSYRTPNGDYSIPVESHAEKWRRSTVPVFGLVYDPDDGLMRWIDITGYLRANPEQDGGSIPVLRDAVLNEGSLRAEFKAALAGYAAGGFGTLMLNLITAGPLQMSAVYDAWALGRFDSKYLLTIRRFIMDIEDEALRRAIWLLSHAGDHPNILYTKHNWIRPEIEQQICPSFKWAPEEVAHMLMAVDPQDWGYHTLGECLDVLFYEDRNITAKLHIAVKLLLEASDIDQATRAATLGMAHARDKRRELVLLIQDYPALMEDEWFHDVAAAVQESGEYSVYG